MGVWSVGPMSTRALQLPRMFRRSQPCLIWSLVLLWRARVSSTWEPRFLYSLRTPASVRKLRSLNPLTSSASTQIRNFLNLLPTPASARRLKSFDPLLPPAQLPQKARIKRVSAGVVRHIIMLPVAFLMGSHFLTILVARVEYQVQRTEEKRGSNAARE